MNYLNAALLCDFYKLSHRQAFPDKTELVLSTWTPRTSRLENVDKVVNYGLQGCVKEYLISFFNENFFDKLKEEVVYEYERIVKNCLGDQNPYTKHLEDLHDLGYLPIKIKALKEGTLVPLRVPMMTIENTDARFFWLPNYLETLLSCELWKQSTSATLALKYKNILDTYSKKTTGGTDFVPFQGHDFSMRGMSGLQDSARTGSGHLLSFAGTDTIPAIQYLEQFYGANVEKELVGCSVNATEHSVMMAGGKDTEFETYKRLITEVYPSGILSIVSDTWDLWKVLSDVIKPLKSEILAREGADINKVVIRPDSGDPVKIVCGDPNGKTEDERKGVVELLWDIFGGDTTAQGFKTLNPAIGCIYGDAITLERCEEICKRLAEKGFASTNMVFGIGSFTYQFNTRDTFGFALKSTLCIVDGEERQIFKDPKTDDGTKKSQKGAVAVLKVGNEIIYKDELPLDEVVEGNLLETVFENGTLVREETFAQIKERLNETI